MPSRTCSAAAPSITAPRRVSRRQLPSPAVITNELPPRRAMAAWKEASVRNDGLKNRRPRIFPASACGWGVDCRDCASFKSASTSSRRKSARSTKRFMRNPYLRRRASGRDRHERIAQEVDVLFLQNVGRQQAYDLRVAAGAGQDAARKERRMHILRGTVEHEPNEKPRTLMCDDRAHRAGVADVCADATHPLQQLF